MPSTPRRSYDDYPGSLKKRYGTPLRFEQMLRSDSERRVYLAGKAADRLWRDSSVVTFEPSEWISSHNFMHENDTTGHLKLDMDEAAVKNDASLPYERPVPMRNLAYWLAELEHVNLDDPIVSSEETPIKETPISPVRIRPDTSQLDDPFVSPIKSQAFSQPTDLHQLFVPHQERSRSRSRSGKGHHRGHSLSKEQTFLEKGQVCHPQPQLKQRQSVPNFSRPLTPDVKLTPKHISPSKRRTIRTRHSDQAIRYERVNGIYLDTTPRSAKERREGLSIPEIEARDLIKIDEWLHEHVPADEVYTSYEPHPARPPPPIGSLEDSVRAISPQPPSAGKNHTFVSRYSWNVEKVPSIIPFDPPTMSITPIHEPVEEEPANTFDQAEPARELLTEIIRGILGPPGDPFPPEEERSSDEYDTARQTYLHHDCPPGYNSVLPGERRGHFREHFDHSRYVVDATLPNRGCSTSGSYRKRIGYIGKSAIKLVTLKQSRQVGLCGGVGTL